MAAEQSDVQIIDTGLAPLPGRALHHLLAELRHKGPIANIVFLGGHAKLITQHSTLKEAFTDDIHFPPERSYQLSIEPVVGRTFISMPQHEHNIYRKLSTPFFNRKAMDAIKDQDIEGICDRLLDPLVSQGRADLVAGFTRLFPLIVISRMLGLPTESIADLHRWALALLSYPTNPEGALEASSQFSDYLLPIIRQRRANPTDDVISRLALSQVGDRLLSDEDIASHIRLLLPTGADTTYLALGNLIYALQTQNQSWYKLLEAPHLIPNAVEELLRWESPTPLIPRMSAGSDMEFAGSFFYANTPVLFGVGSANRDEAIFDNADQFDIERKSDHLLTFGPGLRTCPGMHLARKELQIALSVLLQRCPKLHLLSPDEAQPVGTILRGPKTLFASLR